MRIDYPNDSQISGLRQLWQEAFGDEEAFLDLFFSAGFSPRRCRCIVEDGEIAGALYWLDVSWHGRRGAYLYAVAVAEPFRRKGLCRAMVEDTAVLLKDRGYDGLLLVPGSEPLREMYAGMGFSDMPRKQQWQLQGEIPGSPVSGETYIRRRQNFLPVGGVMQDHADFLQGCCRLFAGEDFLLALTRQEQPQIAELLGAVPQGITPGEKVPFAMYRPLADAPMPDYFAFDFA